MELVARYFILIGVVLSFVAFMGWLSVEFPVSHAKHKEVKPNFVWIFADDLGYHDLGFRNPEVHTPNLDSLATEGVIFTNNYVHAVCTPSRHALLTGKYPHRSSMQNLVIRATQARCTGLDYKLLPEHLKELGYTTHAVGKWNLGYCRNECLPTQRGFDSFFGLYNADGDYWNHTTQGAYDWHNSTGVYLEARGIHSEDLEMERTDEIINSLDAKEPFFLYFTPQNPHTPSEAKDEWLSLYPADVYPEARRHYLGLMSGLDHMVGRIVNGLERKGLMNNTYIIFVADNGADPIEGLNVPFRGGKGSLFEGGTKSASFMYSPLLTKTRYENDGLMHITDWFPTILKLAKGSVPRDDEIDGIDQSQMVTKGMKSKRKNMVYNIDREYDIAVPISGEIGVRDHRYKLIWGLPGFTDGYGDDLDNVMNMPYYLDYVADHTPSRKRRASPAFWTSEQWKTLFAFADLVRVTDEQLANGTGYMQLYDLKDDPYETNDLSTTPRYQGVLSRLVAFVQDEVYNHYVPMSPTEEPEHPLLEVNPKGYLESGWCTDLFPST